MKACPEDRHSWKVRRIRRNRKPLSWSVSLWGHPPLEYELFAKASSATVVLEGTKLAKDMIKSHQKQIHYRWNLKLCLCRLVQSRRAGVAKRDNHSQGMWPLMRCVCEWQYVYSVAQLSTEPNNGRDMQIWSIWLLAFVIYKKLGQVVDVPQNRKEFDILFNVWCTSNFHLLGLDWKTPFQIKCAAFLVLSLAFGDAGPPARTHS